MREIVAIVSKKAQAAADTAKKHNIPNHYGTHKELLADQQDVDAVYATSQTISRIPAR